MYGLVNLQNDLNKQTSIQFNKQIQYRKDSSKNTQPLNVLFPTPRFSLNSALNCIKQWSPLFNADSILPLSRGVRAIIFIFFTPFFLIEAFTHISLIPGYLGLGRLESFLSKIKWIVTKYLFKNEQTHRNKLIGSWPVSTHVMKKHSLVEATNEMMEREINISLQKFPFCIVWTSIPVLTWFIPIIGHMGIAMSNGVIRDFAGPYFVSTDNMAFGKPTKYWILDPTQAVGGVEGWDKAITEASEIYKNRMHNLFCDNCHSHVALALNKMCYDDKSNWNMVNLAFLCLIHGKYVNCYGFLKTWLPFCIITSIIVTLVLLL